MRKYFLYLLLILVSAGMSSCGYNRAVNLQEKVSGQWANVENAYQRRADLIPNLVNTVKGYASHEKQTLEGVIQARSEATKVTLNADNLTEENIKRFERAQEGLTGALSKLMMLRESYPDLKANQNFLTLQAQLEGTENRISVERRKYNEAVQEYNSAIRRFPTVIYAGWFDFRPKPYFEAKQGADVAPTVEF